jgi:hypothetical protein
MYKNIRSEKYVQKHWRIKNLMQMVKTWRIQNLGRMVKTLAHPKS